MIEGPLDKLFDDQMSAEEKAYFNSRGSEQAEDKVSETVNVEQERDVDSGDVSQESEHDANTAEDVSADADRGGEDDESSYESDESDDEPVTKAERDYEKAFKTERHKRKELKEALEAQARKTAEMEAILNQLRQNAQQQQIQPKQEAPQEDIPDPDVDPLGYMQYQIKQQEKALIEHNKYLTKRHEMEQQAMQKQAFEAAYINSAKEYSQKQTDFLDAYKFLVESKTKEYIASGFSPAEAEELLCEDEMTVVSRAYNDKVNPAERIYNLAKSRGYTAGSTSKKAVPAKNLADIKKGLANSKSLKSGGGQLEDKELGIDDIDSMSFDEFDTYWAKLKASSKGMG